MQYTRHFIYTCGLSAFAEIFDVSLRSFDSVIMVTAALLYLQVALQL